MTWTLINRIHAMEANAHYLFTHADGRRAIADHSVSRLSDPGSAEGGLLLLDRSRPVEVKLTRAGGMVARVPVVDRFQQASAVETDPLHAVRWAAEGGATIQVNPKLEKLVRLLAPYVPEPLENAA